MSIETNPSLFGTSIHWLFQTRLISPLHHVSIWSKSIRILLAAKLEPCAVLVIYMLANPKSQPDHIIPTTKSFPNTPYKLSFQSTTPSSSTTHSISLRGALAGNIVGICHKHLCLLSVMIAVSMSLQLCS